MEWVQSSKRYDSTLTWKLVRCWERGNYADQRIRNLAFILVRSSSQSSLRSDEQQPEENRSVTTGSDEVFK